MGTLPPSYSTCTAPLQRATLNSLLSHHWSTSAISSRLFVSTCACANNCRIFQGGSYSQSSLAIARADAVLRGRPRRGSEPLSFSRSNICVSVEHFESASVSRILRASSRSKSCRILATVGHDGLASRDRILEFGKFKGAMLGTMSSKYLKWMAKNLTSGPMVEWLEYAKEVLEDPYYKDRLEWEKVEKLMTMTHDLHTITGNRAVLAPAKAYGWDLEDDAGWRRVNFSLLGTSAGGRIPRIKTIVSPPVEDKKAVRRKKPSSIKRTSSGILSSSFSTGGMQDSSSYGSLRDELIRRRAHRRDRLMANRGGLVGREYAEAASRGLVNPFPGRESLLNSVEL